jgi:peptidylprolyl isomerase
VWYVDLLDGDGPVPAKGQRLYTHFKVWTGGFREGEPRDSSFRQARVYEWNLGTPTDRLVAGADEVALGMREGGWRRAIIPAKLAYGEAGLLREGSTKVYVVPPNSDVYWDFLMVDAGSGKCEAILHPPGVSDKASLRLKSISCLRGVP